MIPDKCKNEVKVDNDVGILHVTVCELSFDTMQYYMEHKATEVKDEGMTYRGIDKIVLTLIVDTDTKSQ